MNAAPIILAELALLATVLGAGLLVISHFPGVHRDFVLPATLSAGLAVIGVAGLAVIIIGNWLRAGDILLLLKGLTAVGIAVCLFQRGRLLCQPGLLLAAIGVAVLFSLRNWTLFTNDSFFLHYVAELIIDRGHLPMEDYGFHFLGHPIWLHVAQVWANALGEPYVRSLFPLAYLLAIWTAIAALKGESKNHADWLLASSAPLILFASYQMVIQGQLANHHTMVALILLVAGILLVRDKSFSAAALAGTMLVAIPLMRMEGSMITGLFIIALLPAIATPGRALAVAGIPAASVLPWVTYLAAQRTDGMLSLVQLLTSYSALVLAGCGAATVLLARSTKWGQLLLSHWYGLCTLAAAGMIILALILNPATTTSNLSIVPLNMLMFGRWGVFWALGLAVALALGAVHLRGVRISTSPFAGFAAFGLLVFGLLFMVGTQRIPYRYNWSDSATRMAVHIAPMMAVWLGERILALQAILMNRREIIDGHIDSPRQEEGLAR